MFAYVCIAFDSSVNDRCIHHCEANEIIAGSNYAHLRHYGKNATIANNGPSILADGNYSILCDPPATLSR